MKKVILLLMISLMLCSCSNPRINEYREYSDTEREARLKNSDLVYEGTIEKLVNIGDGSRFKAQAEETEPDHNWLAVFKIEKIVKGSYEAPSLGMMVHSPTISFGTYLFPIPNKKYRIYLKSQPTDFTDYIVVGNEWIK